MAQEMEHVLQTRSGRNHKHLQYVLERTAASFLSNITSSGPAGMPGTFSKMRTQGKQAGTISDTGNKVVEMTLQDTEH